MSAAAGCAAYSWEPTSARCAWRSRPRRERWEVSPAELPLLVLSVPLWVLLAYAHRLYHLDTIGPTIAPPMSSARCCKWQPSGAGLRSWA